jgi:HEAT repeat protein/tetratricopeptide (TPR) repeat protein
MQSKRTSLLICLFVAAVCFAEETELQRQHRLFSEAEQLRQANESEKAFLAFAKIPGGQHAAIRIGRQSPREYIDLLEKHVGDIPAPLALAIEADLLLALGKTDEAGKCVGKVAQCTTDGEKGWQQGNIPANTYLVDVPQRDEHGYRRHSLLQPLVIGPGSHRDNWLIRRCVALKRWDEAAAEYVRVWKIHRENTKPFIANVATSYVAGKTIYEKKLVTPAGFDGRGLQFALDYAFFLKRQGDLEHSLAVLREPLFAVDMDRNPNHQRMSAPTQRDLETCPLRNDDALTRSLWSWGRSAGVSRKEFLRLAYGAFKDAGKEEALVASLTKKIEAGDNRPRRVLARLRFHQNDVEAALALEEAYVRHADFNDLTAAYRLGRVYENAGKNEKAIEQYEKAAELPDESVNLPDAEEVTRNSYRQQARALPAQFAGPRTTISIKADVASRLQRLYGATAKPEKSYEAMLRQFDANPSLFGDSNQLEQAMTRAQVVDAEQGFHDWLTEKTGDKQLSVYLPTMYWALGRYDDCARVLAEQWKPVGDPPDRTNYSFETWRSRFESLGDEQQQMFLEAVIEADPTNSRARLALLDLKKTFEGPEVVEMLESLLDSEADSFFTRRKGDYHRTKFRNYFDLAYRLLRAYEKAGKVDELRQLGLRIAAGDKPFGQWWRPDPNRTRLGCANEWEEDVNGCLSLLIRRADEATLDKLNELWKDIDDHPAKRQLARRQGRSSAEEQVAGDFGWANVPRGVRLIASNQTVLSVAHDDRYIYAGHPWGIAVYSRAGKPITRIALTEAARAIAVNRGMIWVGTPKGLYRIRRDEWSVAHLYLEGDVPEQRRHSRSWADQPANYWFDNGVYTLAVDGDFLWIGTHRNIQRLDTRTLSLRAYSYRELFIDSWGGFERILVDGEYVWVACGAGLRRYNRETDAFTAVEYGDRGVGLIAQIDGRLFGHVWLNNELRDRPCLIDRHTLEVTPLLIRTDPNQKPPSMNGPFSFFGMYQGRLVFGDSTPAYTLNEKTQQIELIGRPWDRPDDPIDTILPEGHRAGDLFWPQPIQSAQIAGKQPVTEPVYVRQIDGDRWTLLALPDGARLIGANDSYTTRYEYPREDWPFRDIIWDRRLGQDGMYFVDADGDRTRLASQTFGDSVLGDRVFAVVPNTGDALWLDNKETWLCTDLGVSLLDDRHRVRTNFTREDGLCGNRVPTGVAADGKIYFGSGWGDNGGGLIVADPKTRVFTAFYQADGLGTDKIAWLEKDGNALKVTYDVEYGRGNNSFNYRVFQPNRYDPIAGRSVSTAIPTSLDQRSAHAAIAKRERDERIATPYLGGFIIREQTVGDTKYICGTRGLVIVDADAEIQPPRIEELTPQVTADPHVMLQALANQKSIRINSPTDFARYVDDENPYVRARAVEFVAHLARKAPQPYLPPLRKLLKDELPGNRLRAVKLLGELGDKPDVKPIEQLLADPDRRIREAATIALVRLGEQPDFPALAKLLERRTDSNDQFEILGALAKHAEPEAFELLLKHPLHTDEYEPRDKIYETIRQSLLKNPKLADVLLSAYNEDRDPGPESNYGATRFAQEVFERTGVEMLPVLHEALKSENRVIRSNAARACGAIKDPSSKEPLLAALDLESGLSRGSIVWALGELRAKEILPRLAEFYVDARNDERRGQQAGYRYAQSAWQMQSQFESISRLDAIATDYDELTQIAAPEPIRPKANEPLLTPKIILAAVAKIGPESSQQFYRTLAGEDDTEARREAAARLAEGGEADRERNLTILTNLWADSDIMVRMTAGVSLLILGETYPEKQILIWLDSGEPYPQSQLIVQLERIADGKKLAFARDALIRCAAQQKPRNRYFHERIMNLANRAKGGE